jgi:hypothetical protein
MADPFTGLAPAEEEDEDGDPNVKVFLVSLLERLRHEGDEADEGNAQEGMSQEWSRGMTHDPAHFVNPLKLRTMNFTTFSLLSVTESLSLSKKVSENQIHEALMNNSGVDG